MVHGQERPLRDQSLYSPRPIGANHHYAEGTSAGQSASSYTIRRRRQGDRKDRASRFKLIEEKITQGGAQTAIPNLERQGFPSSFLSSFEPSPPPRPRSPPPLPPNNENEMFAPMAKLRKRHQNKKWRETVNPPPPPPLPRTES